MSDEHLHEWWLELHMTKRMGGVELWVKADPSVEALMQSLAGPPDALDLIGGSWHGLDPLSPLHFYALRHDLNVRNVSFNMVGNSLFNHKGGVNLSFLQFVGVSKGDGVKFKITEPMTGDYLRTVGKAILAGAVDFYRAYLVPAHIELLISSKGL